MPNDGNMSAHVQWTERLGEWDIPWISCPNAVAITMGPDGHEKKRASCPFFFPFLLGVVVVGAQGAILWVATLSLFRRCRPVRPSQREKPTK